MEFTVKYLLILISLLLIFSENTLFAETYYSIANGNWDDPNTWSTEGYEGAASTTYPNYDTNEVFIGNNKTVTVPKGVLPEISNLLVEAYNTNPGHLFIDGGLGKISGHSFVLEDGCTLGMQNISGITVSGEEGAIQTVLRTYGVSNYYYYLDDGEQQTGGGLPDKVASVVIDITKGRTCYLTRSGGPWITIRDSLVIKNGIFHLAGNTVLIDERAKISSGEGYTVDDFSLDNYILNIGTIIREIPVETTGNIDLVFPIGTQGIYTYGQVSFHENKVTYDSNAYVEMRVFAEEHPDVKTQGRSLTKYFEVTTNDINIDEGGADLIFKYDDSEVVGSEVSYKVLWYHPKYPDSFGAWTAQPGGSNSVVDSQQKLFYSNQMNEIDGNWTVGENDAVLTMSEEIANSFLRISPNPGFDKVTLQFSLIENTSIVFNITDIEGIVRYSSPEQYFSDGLNSYDINISNLPNGHYFVNVVSGGKLKSEKLVILR